MGKEHAAHGSGYGLYWRTWGWLLGATLLEVGAVLVPATRVWVVLLVIAFALLKAALIVSNFMHLKFERRSLAYCLALPLLFLAAMFAFFFPDALRL